jgi:DNA-binding NarL/FixJ family response regulator
MERIRLLLIDDHLLFRESLGRLFASEDDMEVVGQCATTADALALLRNSAVDLILLDFNLGTERGTDLIAAVRRAEYSGKILMVTGAMDANDSLAALQAGAAGIFLKHNSPTALTQAIRMVAGGEAWLDKRIVQLLTARVPPEQPAAFGTPLSRREEQVLQGVLQGSTNRKIATDLGISEGAVKAGIQQLFRKTGVRTRSQLVRAALEGRPLTSRM